MASLPLPRRRSAAAIYYEALATYSRDGWRCAEELAISAVARELGLTSAGARAKLFARLP